MRFINYDGKKPDRYNDVLDYAKSQQNEDSRRERDKIVASWISKMLDGKDYSKLSSQDLLKILVVKYRELLKIKNNLYDDFKDIVTFDKEQLWKDFWCDAVVKNLNRVTSEETHQKKLFEAFINKLFVLDIGQTTDDYFDARNNSRYKKYIEKSFNFEKKDEIHYIKLLFHINTDGEALNRFIDIYSQWIILAEYYFYSSFRPKDNFWMNEVEKELAAISEIKQLCQKRTVDKPEYRKLCSPLSKFNRDLLSGLLYMYQVVLFKLNKPKKEDDEMIEMLYSSILDNSISIEHIDSIMPMNIKDKIENGILPEYDKTNRMFLSNDEDIYYVNHAVIFTPIESDDEIEFKEYKGVFYISNKRVIFEFNKKLIPIPVTKINRIVHYDMIPEILEINLDEMKYYFQVPEAEVALKVFKMISALNNGKEIIKEKNTYTYESLLAENSITANLYAIKNVSEIKFDGMINEQLDSLVDKLEKIREAADKYPERKSEIEAFIIQYTPETIKILLAYKQYNEIGYEAVAPEQMYDKIISTLSVFSEALYKKIYNVYQEQAIGIIAQANMLSQSLEGENVFQEKLPFKIDELAEKADINACIFAFEYIKGYNLEQEMKSGIESIHKKLLGIKQTIELYPDREDEIQRFLRYYIPEAVRIVVSYNQYQKGGLDETTLNKVYTRVMESIITLNSAIETKIKDIYKLATMNTVAQADALKIILGQDGFAQGNNILKH